MIKLTFAIGGNIRKVFIDKRVISMLTAETGFVPVQMDLDKINEKKIVKKMGDETIKLLRELSFLETEQDMAQDIIKDFQATGWRCVKREHGNN